MESPISRIYVVNTYDDYDLKPLEQFSTEPLVILTKGTAPYNNFTAYCIAKQLASFNADTDYLAITGSAVLSALTVAIMKETYHLKSFNILLYHRNKECYTIDRIDGLIEI